MQQKLNDIKIRNFKPSNKLVKLSDGGSLFVHIQPNGTKRFVMAYRYEGKQRSYSIGVYPEVSLRDARVARDEARALLAKGIDPTQHRQEVKTNSETNNSFSFFKMAEVWFDFYKVDKAEITSTKNWRLLEMYVFEDISKKDIREIARLELVNLIEKVVDLGYNETAKKVARLISMVFDNAVNRGVIDYSVAQRLSSIVPAHKVINRPAIFDPKELGILLRAIDDDMSTTNSVKYGLKVLPYVFVRNTELRCARWEEIDLDKGEWLIPAERMKMKEPHFVPLARQVVELFREIKEKSDNQTLVFPSTVSRSRPISDNSLRVALLRLGYEKEEISVHGFRSTASTLLHEQGYNSDVIERQLAHKDTNIIRATYNHAEFKDERIKMMQDWADYLDKIKSD